MNAPEHNLISVFIELNEDVKRSIKMLVQSRNLDEQELLFWRRVYVRAVYALIEGVTYRMKQYAIDIDNDDKKLLSQIEILLLQEDSYDLSDKGELIKSKVKIPINKSIKIAFIFLSKVNEIEYKLNISASGWQSFTEGLKIRDRITHPKNAEDLMISKEEEELVAKAALWFVNSFNECFFKIREKLESS